MAPLAPLASRLLQSSLDLAGPALASASQRRGRRRAAATVVRAIGGGPGAPIFPEEAPHPLLPSAVRVERSRHHGHSGSADQFAVTLWFRGDGPDLPATIFAGGGGGGARGELGRIALRVGAGLARAGVGLAGAAALGAATVAANRLEAARRPSHLPRIR